MKKELITGFLSIGLFLSVNGQVALSNQVLSSLGGSYSGSVGQYDYTIGQVVQETIQFPGNIVSQGFQQPPFALRFPESAGVFCNGDSIVIPVEAVGFRSAQNVFTAELSDATGSWATPIAIDSDTGNTSTVLRGRLPFSIPAGSQYRIRVRSSVPAFTNTSATNNQIDFCYVRLKVEALIEGMHQGQSSMPPLLYNLGLSDDPTACDTILVSLMYPAPPYTDIWNCSTILHSDGTAYCLFPSIIYGPGSFQLRLRHRSGVEVWSKTLITPLSPELEFSFKD
jgi:hypothetical protein